MRRNLEARGQHNDLQVASMKSGAHTRRDLAPSSVQVA
jgi:hypothetical protein